MEICKSRVNNEIHIMTIAADRIGKTPGRVEVGAMCNINCYDPRLSGEHIVTRCRREKNYGYQNVKVLVAVENL